MANYFPRKEFKCSCCGEVRASGWLVHLLNKVREAYGKPMIINSGYRCKKHNEEIGGSPNSAHMKGLAADIRCDNSTDRYILLPLLASAFKRVGISEDFIHVDVSDELPQKKLWVYT